MVALTWRKTRRGPKSTSNKDGAMLTELNPMLTWRNVLPTPDKGGAEDNGYVDPSEGCLEGGRVLEGAFDAAVDGEAEESLGRAALASAWRRHRGRRCRLNGRRRASRQRASSF